MSKVIPVEQIAQLRLTYSGDVPMHVTVRNLLNSHEQLRSERDELQRKVHDRDMLIEQQRDQIKFTK